ncbi:hypothetical protein Ocin01_16226 [Orchesella cincta]|uniref:Uncharacterized protein n=1 Tax=Orchesella cincta TaxID=48709 RepID=A0A1D2MBS6_ORCCI|nr:hypothetical protein Ocin01_16226 [Orchesella cincta]
MEAKCSKMSVNLSKTDDDDWVEARIEEIVRKMTEDGPRVLKIWNECQLIKQLFADYSDFFVSVQQMTRENRQLLSVTLKVLQVPVIIQLVQQYRGIVAGIGDAAELFSNYLREELLPTSQTFLEATHLFDPDNFNKWLPIPVEVEQRAEEPPVDIKFLKEDSRIIRLFNTDVEQLEANWKKINTEEQLKTTLADAKQLYAQLPKNFRTVAFKGLN